MWMKQKQIFVEKLTKNVSSSVTPAPALPPTAQKKIDQEMQAKKDLSSQMKQLESAPKSEPSREIWSIIKTHQNRPIPPPKPLMPVR